MIARLRNSPLLLWVVPILLPVIALLFRARLGDFDADPSYAYLLNALGLLHFHAPSLVWHPVTPVQTLSALLIGLIWLVRLPWARVSPPTDVLVHPELYLWCISLVFVMMGAAAIYFFGRQLRSTTGSVAVAIVAQLSFLLSVPLLSAGIIDVGPEELLVGLTTLLAALVVPLVFSAPPVRPHWRDAAMVGTVIGACIATKVTAAPLILAALYFDERRAILTTVLAAGAALIAFTLPVAVHYPEIARSMFGLVIHSGHYGEGAVGLPSWAALRQNAFDLYREVPEMFLALVACAGLGTIGVGERLKGKASFQRQFLVSGAILALEFAMVIKHPGIRYIMPAVAITALANAGLCYVIVLLQDWRRWAAAAIVSGLVAFGLWRGLTTSAAYFANEGDYQQVNLDFLAKYANGSSGCMPVYYYDAPVTPYKLLFGDSFADHYFGRALAALYPGFLSYNPWAHSLETFDAGLIGPAESVRTLSRAACVHFVGSNLERFDEFGVAPDSMTRLGQALPEARATAVYDLRLPLRLTPGQ